MKKTLVSITISLLVAISFQTKSQSKIIISDDIHIYPLHDSIYVHVTFDNSAEYGRFSSNGLIFIKNGEAILIDTPMDNAKTEAIHRFLKDSMNVDIKMLIIGHFHDDCLGGLEYIKSQGIESIANELTVEKCRELGLPIPSKSFKDSLVFDFNGERVVCRYLGGGHTADNITVWFPNQQVLFGGCLIRSMQTQNLGNIADAVVNVWADTVTEVIKNCQNVKVVIPGHGRWGGNELLFHTVELAKKHCAQ
jgi:metallo-beta-lactamase class B